MAGQKESVTVAKPRLPHWFVVFFVPIGLTLLFVSISFFPLLFVQNNNSVSLY